MKRQLGTTWLWKREASRASNARKATLDLNRISLRAEQTKANIRRQVSQLERQSSKNSRQN